MMKTEVTIVVPTMWRSQLTPALIEAWKEVPNAEILVIDNAPEHRPRPFSGLQILPQAENIGVNRAWNLGVQKAQGEFVVLCNDDILFEAQRWWLIMKRAISRLEHAIIGMHPLGLNRTEEQLGEDAGDCKSGDCIGLGWGSLLAFRRADYPPVPESMRIWFGDAWLAQKLRPWSMVIPMTFEVSKTSGAAEFRSIFPQDERAAEGYGLFISRKNERVSLLTARIGDSGFQHRMATEEDEAGIQQGFVKAFHHDRSHEEWKWRYQRPWHDSVQQVGVSPKGEIVAHVGWYADRAQIQGFPVVCMQGGDVYRVGEVTRADLGLISDMHVAMFGHLDAVQTVAWTYGFQAPKIRARSQRSYGIHANLPLPHWTKSTSRSRGRFRLFARFRQSWRIEVHNTVAFHRDAIDALWLRAVPRYRVSIIRDADWFAHRYDDHPVKSYKHIAVIARDGGLAGWATIGERLGNAMLVDLVWDGVKSAQLMDLLDSVREECRKLGYTQLTTWLVGDPDALSVLRTTGWNEEEDPQGIGLAVRHVHPALHRSDYPDGHYVTAGYSDLV